MPDCRVLWCCSHLRAVHVGNRPEDVVLDAAEFGNWTRFFASRRSAAKLNVKPCDLDEVQIGEGQSFAPVGFFATRRIEEHEELRFDYGPSFDWAGQEPYSSQESILTEDISQSPMPRSRRRDAITPPEESGAKRPKLLSK